VKWSFTATSVGNNKSLIKISAAIPDGWHLYSQHLEEGGPQPTRILFDSNKSFALLGRPEETGTCASFYDSLYEMQITWFTRTAVFEQEVLLHDPKATAKGVIEFMVCNDHVCVPGKQAFALELSSIR
jgi:thiol:disulfide interchange protein DsbD